MNAIRHLLTAASFIVTTSIPFASHASTFLAGVNLAGLESNSTALPGRPNFDYGIPSASELAYYSSKGIKTVRLPILWARLQPNLLSGNTALDPTYLGIIKTILAEAAANGVQVIVDVHNFGGYATHKIGDGTVTPAQFANFWKLAAQSLRGTPGLGGYDLMNEPAGMPVISLWPVAAQAAVNAIRTVDTSTYVFVEGYFYASSFQWLEYNANLSINDPAGRLVYEAHVYGDRDGSGTHFDWNTEVSNGVTVDTIAQRVSIFGGWCQQRRVACAIGEVGVGNNNPQWNVQLANGLAEMRSLGFAGFTYWAGGPWWGTYAMSIEPHNGVDATQMSVVSQYAQ